MSEAAEPQPGVLPVTSNPSELVVELPYQEFVLEELAKMGVTTDAKPDADATLGLARLHGLRHGWLDATLKQPDPTFTPVDALLIDLRKRLASRFGGWVPEMGKNRDLASVAPFPGGSGKAMAVSDPVVVTEKEAGVRPQGEQGAGVVVAILDTAAYKHPWLDGHVRDHASLPDRPSHAEPWPPWVGHATFVAGCVRRQAPGASLVLREVLAFPDGKTTAWDLAKALVAFRGSDVDIVNLSLGCRTADGQAPLVLRRAVERLGQGIVVVAAAGNLGDTDFKRAPIWPAALPGVVAVGSSQPRTVPSTADPSTLETIAFSPKLPWVEWLADGGNVAGAYISGAVTLSTAEQKTFAHYARWSGTSFAAATFSGALAARLRHGHAREALDDFIHGALPAVVTPFVFRQDSRDA